jgi:hypothetical protein
MRDFLRGTGLVVGAVGFGLLAAWSFARWDQLIQEAPARAAEEKAAALEAGELTLLHHVIHGKVGEKRWENEVKPEFLKRLTARVVQDTGNPFPDSAAVNDWLRTHRDEAKKMLEDAAGER